MLASMAESATIAALGYLPLNASDSARMISHEYQRNIMSELTSYEELQMDQSSMSSTSVGAGNNFTNSTDDVEFVLPYSYPEMVLIAIVAGFLSLLTVVGNCMVMISFKIDKQLQTISNYFLFSLAVADFAIGLISMPLFTVYILAGRWQLGPYVCDTWLSLDYLASNASVLNLLIISFDRYFSVTRPLTYRARRTPRRAGIMIAAAWVISLVLWPPWIYAWPYIEGDRKVPEDKCFIQFIETNNYITFGTAIAAFYAPVTVMCVLYWRVWRETEKRQKDLSNLQAGKKNDSHRSNSSGEEQAMLVTDGAFIGEHHHYRAGANSLNADWRRSRSESSGPVEDIDAYVTGGLAGSQRRHGGRLLVMCRRWLRLATWQHWLRNITRQPQQRSRRRGDDAESYSEGSNVVTTPASVETPIASSISRGTSMNLIRDPYSSTPVRFKAAAAAAAANDLRLASADRRRTLVSSRSLSQSEQKTQADFRANALRDGADNGDDANYQEGELDPNKRSHSADSVFTILIRLPPDNYPSDKSEHQVSIRMLPANLQAASSAQRSRQSASSMNLASGNPPAVRSRSVPVGTEQHGGYGQRPGGNSYGHYNSSYSLAAHQSRSAAYNDSSSSLLCGTNLHLPNAFSLGKLGSLAKPTHLPLHKGRMKSHQASPWVPRSCMPVAQSPLIVRCTRFSSSSCGLDSAGRLVSPRGADRAPSVLNVGVEASRASRPNPSTGALQTVSATVSASNSAGSTGLGGHPPVRRPNSNQFGAGNAAAAKKGNKKPKKKNQEKRQERKAAKTLSAILLAFILTWTPYNVLTLLKALAPCDKDDCFSSELWNFSYYLCYINSTINPVCYALCNASFRRTYVRILTCKWHSRTKTAVQRGVYN